MVSTFPLDEHVLRAAAQLIRHPSAPVRVPPDSPANMKSLTAFLKQRGCCTFRFPLSPGTLVHGLLSERLDCTTQLIAVAGMPPKQEDLLEEPLVKDAVHRCAQRLKNLPGNTFVSWSPRQRCEWLCSQAFVSFRVEPCILANALLDRGLVKVEEASGQSLMYDWEKLRQLRALISLTDKFHLDSRNRMLCHPQTVMSWPLNHRSFRVLKEEQKLALFSSELITKTLTVMPREGGVVLASPLVVAQVVPDDKHKVQTLKFELFGPVNASKDMFSKVLQLIVNDSPMIPDCVTVPSYGHLKTLISKLKDLENKLQCDLCFHTARAGIQSTVTAISRGSATPCSKDLKLALSVLMGETAAAELEIDKSDLRHVIGKKGKFLHTLEALYKVRLEVCQQPSPSLTSRLRMWPSIEALPRPSHARKSCQCACRNLPKQIKWALGYFQEPLPKRIERLTRRTLESLKKYIKQHLDGIKNYSPPDYDDYDDYDAAYGDYGQNGEIWDSDI